jgi:DNA-binding GntR family transcriptional regulator
MGFSRWNPQPLYRQLADELRAEITSGKVAPGQPLPSENELVQRYGVAKDTVRAALAALRSEGLIVTLWGRGSYIPLNGKH